MSPVCRKLSKKTAGCLCIPLLHSVKNEVFDRMTEVNKGPKTSKPDSSAYIGTVETGLRSKTKPLRSKLYAILIVLKYILFA